MQYSTDLLGVEKGPVLENTVVSGSNTVFYCKK